MAAESWRPVPGFERLYEVSDTGRVRSLARTDRMGRNIIARVLRPGLASNGYLTVCLNRDGKRASVPVQHLVAAAFIGPRPVGTEVCHGDGVRVDNTLGNLRYDTPKGNHADRVRHGTVPRGLDNGGLLADEQVKAIRAARYRVSQKALALKFGVSPACVQAVQDGRTYRHV